MKDLLTFLREHPLSWILPIVIVFGRIFWLAWSITATPENPFAYRAD